MSILIIVTSAWSSINIRHLEKATVSMGKECLLSEGNAAYNWSRYCLLLSLDVMADNEAGFFYAWSSGMRLLKNSGTLEKMYWNLNYLFLGILIGNGHIGDECLIPSCG